MRSERNWEGVMQEVVSALAARGEQVRCDVQGNMLAIQLPATGGCWDECKAALLWPSQELHAVLEVRPGTGGESAALSISVQSRMSQVEEENQLMWYLNKTKDVFLRRHLHGTQETPKRCRLHHKLAQCFPCLLRLKSMFKRRRRDQTGATNHDGPKVEGAVHEGHAQEVTFGANHPDLASLIVTLHAHLVSRLEGAGSYCIICDAALPRARRWPSLCVNETCVSSFETTRRPGDLHLLATSPQAAELLISWASCVADLLGGNNRHKLYLGKQSTPPVGEWHRIGNSLTKLPTPLPASSPSELECALRNADAALPVILAWLFSTYRGHLVPLDGEVVSQLFPQEVLKVVKDIQVFLVYPSDERRMLAFCKRRERGGERKMFFHGAVWPKWHTIIRTELKDVSGSHTNVGPSTPSGVYLSPHFDVSAEYAWGRWSTQVDFSRYRRCCVALCEVVHTKRIKIYDNPCNASEYRYETVVPEEEDVLVRGLVTYGAAFTGAAFKNSEKPKVRFQADQLWRALERIPEFRKMSAALYGVSSGL